MLDKASIIRILEEIAIYLEIKGENAFKVRAYRIAAHALEGVIDDLQQLIDSQSLSKIPGVGKALSEKIETLYTSGHLDYYEDLKASIPQGLLECLSIPGLGPKKIHHLYQELNIESLEDLTKACENGHVAQLKGFGEKTQVNILHGIQHLKTYNSRHLRIELFPIVTSFLDQLKGLPNLLDISIAGSYRRGLETVGDLDFVASSNTPIPIMQAFTQLPEVEQITALGETKSSIRLKTGVQVDLRIVPPEQYPFALHHFTGSKDHNIQLRSYALSKGLSLSEWGLRPAHSQDTYDTHGIHSESDLFKYLGLSFIPPELREGMGEIEFAKQHSFSHLIERSDIRGAFHNHTTASDGRDSLEAMAKAADALGWEYLGIADHSKSSFQANGLSEERLLAQIETIQKINASKRFRVHLFTGIECDILADGRLDFSDDILKRLDYVVASVHSGFTQDEAQMTKRIIKALEHPYVSMLGHVSGRLLLKREAYAVNIPKIIEAAIANKKIIELNAQPKRLDMDWRFWRQSIHKGLVCSINPDAHSAQELSYVDYAIPIARKAFLSKESVFNTKTLLEIKAYFKH